MVKHNQNLQRVEAKITQLYSSFLEKNKISQILTVVEVYFETEITAA